MFGQRLGKEIRRSMKRSLQITSVPHLNGGLNNTHDKTTIGDNQLQDCKNVWWHHGALRGRPGFKLNYEGTCNKAPVEVKVYKRGLITCVYSKYYDTITLTDRSSISFSDGNSGTTYVLSGTEDAPVIIEWGGKALCYLNASIISADQNGTTTATPTAPYVLLNGKPSLTADNLNGTTFVGYNRLTGAYKAKYTSDNAGAIYSLPAASSGDITATYTDEDGNAHTLTVPSGSTSSSNYITINIGGTQKNVFLFTNTNRTIFYYGITGPSDPQILPSVGFSGNIDVTATKSSNDYPTIGKCTISAWFGGTRNAINNGSRLFMAGNPDTPSTIYWSDVNDPLYFPENNYAVVGDGTEIITNLCQLGEYLVIFTEKSIYAMQYVSNTVTAEDIENGYDAAAIAAYFPISQIASPAGCDTKTACLVNNRVVWMNTDGTAWCLTGLSQYDERFIRKIDEEVAMTVLSSATAYSDGENYYCLNGRNIYVLVAEDWRNYGWYKWELPDQNYCSISSDGISMWNVVNNSGKVYLYTPTQTDDDIEGGSVDVSGYFVTKSFTCGLPHMYKHWHKGYVCAGGEGTMNLAYNGTPDLTTVTLAEVYPHKYFIDETAISMAMKVSFTGAITVAEIVLKYSIYEEAR